MIPRARTGPAPLTRPGESTDDDLLRRAAKGEEHAVLRLYEDHVDGLYAFVFYRVGRDAAIAEDVVQDTFLQALERARRLDPLGRLAP